MSLWNNEMVWWITIVDLPALTGLLGLVLKTRYDHETTEKHLREIIETRHSQLREALAGFKLEVAKNYAAIADMRALEARLTHHLLRIEKKLDHTTMRTEALHGARRYIDEDT